MMPLWELMGLFVGLLILAIVILCWSVARGQKLISLLLSLIMIVGVSVGYSVAGSWSALRAFVDEQYRHHQAQAVLTSINSPQELVDQLKQHLQQDPNRSRGWFLLGRLYVSQNQWSLAARAFTKAHELDPDDEPVSINLIQSQWQLNHRQFNASIDTLLQAVIRRNPNQVDALSFLALEAFQQHRYQRAVDYWTRLLELAPQGSEDALAIRRAIAKAQSMQTRHSL